MNRSLLSRCCLIAGVWASPGLAWTFSPDPVCTLTRAEPAITVEVTYDPRSRTYAIRLTRPGGWPDGPVFSIAFGGTGGFMITTDRHVIQGDTLVVTDTGFGNVLSGIEKGTQATALIGDAATEFSLQGADDPVARFRACTDGATV